MDWPIGNPWVLLAAVGLDLLMGDPPNRFHPVAWMGAGIELLRRRAPTQGKWKPLCSGFAIVVLGIGLCALGGSLVLLLKDYACAVGLIVEAIVLSTMFSVRGLARAAEEVRQALVAGNLAEARRLLSWHLVSRETTGLDEARVAAAAIESVAENTSDGILAPWLFYLAGGLPAALVYRFVNTADAMLGYRDAEREWLGKIPARLDDVLNLLPARLTAACILLAAPFVGGRWCSALPVWWRDARKSASPNAGHPMAAAAGALGVELEKVGYYQLGVGNRLPVESDIRRAVWLLYATAGMVLALTIGITQLVRLWAW
jgi:adenosylcobinamide-phosphate synthase